MSPFLDALNSVLQRDLDKLENEIAGYPTQESIWKISGTIKNSGGTLCLHLCGNLQHFIGTILGQSGYVRDREKEFSLRDLPAAQLITEIRSTKEVINKTLRVLDDDQLQKEYPINVFGDPMNTQYFLMHLAGHLNYHLGQINYHRRLLA